MKDLNDRQYKENELLKKQASPKKTDQISVSTPPKLVKKESSHAFV